MLPLYSGRIDANGDRSTKCFAVIPSTFKHLNKIDISYYLGYGTYQTYPASTSGLQIELVKRSFTGEEIIKSLDVTSTNTINGEFTTSLLVDHPMDPNLSYSIRVRASDYAPSHTNSTNSIVKDIRIHAIE
jgi:hypothetical protein